MRLSEAILLGDSLRLRNGWEYYNPAKNCGCALGGAMLAIGHNAHNFIGVAAGGPELRIIEQWPWLTMSLMGDIGFKFLQVERGQLTIEQLADYVRSIEPPEMGLTRPEPCAVEMLDKLPQ